MSFDALSLEKEVTYEFRKKKTPEPTSILTQGSRRYGSFYNEEGRKLNTTGAIVIGDKGKIMYGSHGADGVRIIPESKMKDYKQPAQTLPRVRGHHNDWLQAIKNNKQAGSNFDYGGPLTELVQLGIIAIKMLGRKLEWDSENMQFTNCSDANRLINPSSRKGWTL